MEQKQPLKTLVIGIVLIGIGLLGIWSMDFFSLSENVAKILNFIFEILKGVGIAFSIAGFAKFIKIKSQEYK